MNKKAKITKYDADPKRVGHKIEVEIESKPRVIKPIIDTDKKPKKPKPIRSQYVTYVALDKILNRRFAESNAQITAMVDSKMSAMENRLLKAINSLKTK